MKKVKTILISQPKPEGKSPYAALEKKHKLKIDYRPFIHLEELSAIEFKEQRIFSISAITGKGLKNLVSEIGTKVFSLD